MCQSSQVYSSKCPHENYKHLKLEETKLPL